MGSFFENAASIILAAATNSLGFAALVILVCGFWAYMTLKDSPLWIRIGIFTMLFSGGLGFAYVSGLKTPPDIVQPPKSVIEIGGKSAREGSEDSLPEVSQSLIAVGFRYNLYGCERNLDIDAVECEFSITNVEEEDRSMRVRTDGGTHFISSDGLDYNASRVSLAGGGYKNSYTKDFVNEIQIKGLLYFPDIPEEIEVVNLFQIHCDFPYRVGSSGFYARFQDVGISG